MDTLGKRLRFAREKAGKSQEQMATEVGKKGYRAWANYEAGRAEPSIDVLKLAAKVFDLDFTWLVTGEGEQMSSSLPSIDSDLFMESAKELAQQASDEGKIIPGTKMLSATVEYYNAKISLINARDELVKSGKLVELRKSVLRLVAEDAVVNG